MDHVTDEVDAWLHGPTPSSLHTPTRQVVTTSGGFTASLDGGWEGRSGRLQQRGQLWKVCRVSNSAELQANLPDTSTAPWC